MSRAAIGRVSALPGIVAVASVLCWAVATDPREKRSGSVTGDGSPPSLQSPWQSRNCSRRSILASRSRSAFPESAALSRSSWPNGGHLRTWNSNGCPEGHDRSASSNPLKREAAAPRGGRGTAKDTGAEGASGLLQQTGVTPERQSKDVRRISLRALAAETPRRLVGERSLCIVVQRRGRCATQYECLKRRGLVTHVPDVCR